ncbi:MAG: TolC family protein [Acidobacteriota bacterium]|nr:TolC family protein [Acidobacteriota bacterium]
MRQTLAIGLVALMCGAAAPGMARAAGAPAAGAPDAPLTLKQAVQLALHNSRDVALAEAQRRVSADDVQNQRAQFGPNLFTGSGAVYTYGFPQTVGGAAPSIVNLSYTQTIFNRAARGQVNAARARLAGQTAAVVETRDDVIERTASAYLELVAVRRSLAAQQAAQASAHRLVTLTRDLVTAGRKLPADALRAELEAARLDQSLVQLEGREGIVEGQLRALLGLAPEAHVEVEETAGLPAVPAVPAAQLVAQTLKTNPSVRRAEDALQASRATLAGARGAYWPSVALVGQYGLFGHFNNYDQYFQRFQRNNLNVGVQVQVPIFSAQTSAAAALAASQVAEADSRVAQQREALTAQVSGEVQVARQRRAALDVANLQDRLAAETVRELTARYQAGFVSLSDVERARLQQGDATVQRVEARLAAQQAELALWKTTGRLDLLTQ